MIKATKKNYGLTFADVPNKETISSIVINTLSKLN